MKEITFIPSIHSASQIAIFTMAATGIASKGDKAYISDDGTAPTKAVACWGWKKGKKLHKRGHDVLVFERGYLGDRYTHTSIAWNGLNGYGDFCLPDQIKGDRFKKFAKLKPWQYTGDIIVIMGQIRGDQSLRGQDLTEFYENIAAELESLHSKPVLYRPHPRGGANNFSPNIPVLEGDLNSALNRAYLVVTYNSNSAVDSVINGVPALSFDPGSMAFDVTGHEGAAIIRPDREEWAHKLAYCQFSPDEIKNADYWERYKCKLDN